MRRSFNVNKGKEVIKLINVLNKIAKLKKKIVESVKLPYFLQIKHFKVKTL